MGRRGLSCARAAFLAAAFLFCVRPAPGDPGPDQGNTQRPVGVEPDPAAPLVSEDFESSRPAPPGRRRTGLESLIYRLPIRRRMPAEKTWLAPPK